LVVAFRGLLLQVGKRGNPHLEEIVRNRRKHRELFMWYQKATLIIDVHVHKVKYVWEFIGYDTGLISRTHRRR